MRCHCCDRALSDTEIQILPDKTFEMCTTCLEISLDAAYSDGFVREDPPEEQELEDVYGSGAVETLDIDTFRSYYDNTDYHQERGPYEVY